MNLKIIFYYISPTLRKAHLNEIKIIDYLEFIKITNFFKFEKKKKKL